ncbi:MAG: iron ABC transporter permease [Oscillospiraceae bacterium]|nr:iron ABC transporter permease [Oscillospiraceae bacterium]
MKSWRTFSIRRSPDNRIPLFAVLAVLTVLAGAASLCLGPVLIPPGELLEVLLGRMPNTPQAKILLFARLPRTCGCLLAGMALAVSGAVIQGVLRNPLAAPHIIGVSSGAGLMVTLWGAVAPTAAAVLPLAAFLGALAGVVLVLLIAEKTGAARITVVLAGVAVSSMFNAGIDAVITLFPHALNGYSDFRIGGLSGLSMSRILPAFWVILAAFLFILSLAGELDLLLLGTETAQSLGLRAKPLRLILLILAAALAGAAVSFSGLLGFVGLIVPHIMRRLVGEESRPLLLASALGGAALLTGCDLLSRLLFAPYELPVGIVLSLAGGPFFLWLLLRQRGGRIHD